MSETARSTVWDRFPGGRVMVRGIRINRLAVRALKSATAGLVLAIVAAGAADNVDLPDELQLLVSQLDIASYFPMVANFANPITVVDADALAADVLGDGVLAGAEHEISSAVTSATRAVLIATSLARLRCSPAEAEQVFELPERFVDALRAR